MLTSCRGLVSRCLMQGPRAVRSVAFGGVKGLAARTPAVMWGLQKRLSGGASEEAKRSAPVEIREYMGMRGGTILNIDESGRLDTLLCKHRPSLPFSLIQRLIRRKKVNVLDSEGQWQRLRDPGSIVASGKTLHVQSKTYEETEDELPIKETARLVLSDRERRDLVSSVLVQHRDVIMINKPSGLAVQGGSLMGRHLDRMTHALVPEGVEAPILVHRLDRQTSGVLALARSADAAARIAEAFRGEEGMASKTYYAVVWPVPRDTFGCIDRAIEKVLGSQGQPDRVKIVESGGKRAVTHYEVVSKSPDGGGLLRLTPTTGRTHQLRVHCADALKCSIVGDWKYAVGHKAVRAKLGAKPSKLCLHAHTLKLTFRSGDGRGGETTVEASAPIPEHMWAVMKKLGIPCPEALAGEQLQASEAAQAEEEALEGAD